jgi:hypothetical protein
MAIFRSGQMDNPAVEAIGLTRQFDKRLAVDQLHMQVAKGEFFGFLGPNGAGKSTAINMLVGLLLPTEGIAQIDGIDIWQNPLEAKRRRWRRRLSMRPAFSFWMSHLKGSTPFPGASFGMFCGSFGSRERLFSFRPMFWIWLSVCVRGWG